VYLTYTWTLTDPWGDIGLFVRGLHFNRLPILGSSLKTGPAGPVHVKIALDIIAVDTWHWSIFSLQYRYNDHIWEIQPVNTLLRALRGQTLALFNLGWRLPFRIFWIKIHIKTVNESKIKIHMTHMPRPPGRARPGRFLGMTPFWSLHLRQSNHFQGRADEHTYPQIRPTARVANSPGLTRILRVSAFDLRSSGLVLQSPG